MEKKYENTPLLGQGDGMECQFDFWIYQNVKKGTLNLLSLLRERKGKKGG